MTQISFGSLKSKNSKGKVRISYQEVRISGFWHELYELQFVMVYPVIKCKCFLVFNTEIPFLSMSRISRIQSCWMELLSCYSSRSYSSSCLEISIADVATTVLNVSQRPFSCLEILVHTTDSRVGIPANTREQQRRRADAPKTSSREEVDFRDLGCVPGISSRDFGACHQNCFTFLVLENWTNWKMDFYVDRNCVLHFRFIYSASVFYLNFVS